MECPHCEEEFLVAQNKSIGATYARKWVKLPKFHIAFVSWWIRSEYRVGSYEKITLRDAYKQSLDGYVSDDAFNARMSELLSAGKIYGTPLVERNSNEFDTTRHTKHAPVYKLNVERAYDVLNNGGRFT